MSIKIKVSYETNAEIDRIIDLLRPLGLRVKPAHKKGDWRFERCYLYSKEDHRPNEGQYPIK